MDTFDDFLRGELTRLNEYGEAQSLGHDITTGVARIASKFSDRAKGTVNLKDKIKELVTGFKVHLGEQQIRYNDARLEDFIEFLRKKVMGFPPEDFNKYAYGGHIGPSAQQEQVDGLLHKIAAIYKADQTAAPEDEDAGDPRDQILNIADNLVELADGDKATEVAVVKGMWQLVRAHPGLVRILRREHNDFIGHELPATKLYQVATAIAKIILGAGNAGAPSKSTDAKPDATSDEEAGLDEGMVPYPPRSILNARYNGPLFDQIEAAGIKPAIFRNAAVEIASAITSQNVVETDRVVGKLNNRFTRDECIRLTRIMLQYFARKEQGTEGLETLITLAKDNVQERFETALSESMLLMRRAKLDAQSGEKQYDAGEVNRKLASIISTEVPAAKMLALMIHCLNLQMT